MLSVRRRTLLVCAAAALLAGCGYVGEVQPPALNIPVRVTDLTAVQRGSNLIVTFTLPSTTTEGIALKKPGNPEVQIGSKVLPVQADKPGPVTAEFPATDWIDQQPTVKVRVPNSKGRFSVWSNEVMVSVIRPLGVPASFQAEPAPKGVKLSWQEPDPRPGEQFRIQRKDSKLIATATGSPYVDTDAKPGQEYEYRVQAFVATAESEWSPYIKITPKDVFPPEVPAGLTALAGISTVELSWDPSTAEDLKVYRVYRSEENGEFKQVADVETPAYSDKQVQAGKLYRYAISSIDQTGNESAKSAPAEIRLQ